MGTVDSQLQWNRASNHIMGTNKSPTLRFEKMSSKCDITDMVDINNNRGMKYNKAQYKAWLGDTFSSF